MATSPHGDFYCQAFSTAKGKKILFINPRNKEVKINLPADVKDASVQYVNEHTGEDPVAKEQLTETSITLQPYEVAVVELK